MVNPRPPAHSWIVVSIRAAQPPRCLGFGTLHEPRFAVNPDVRVGRSAVIRSALRQFEPDLGHALGAEAQEGAVGGGVAQPVGADQHALLNGVTVYYHRDRIERRGLPRASGKGEEVALERGVGDRPAVWVLIAVRCGRNLIDAEPRNLLEHRPVGLVGIQRRVIRELQVEIWGFLGCTPEVCDVQGLGMGTSFVVAVDGQPGQGSPGDLGDNKHFDKLVPAGVAAGGKGDGVGPVAGGARRRGAGVACNESGDEAVIFIVNIVGVVC